MFKEKIGLIDIGSNTVRLVVYGIDDKYNFTELQNIKTPARLSLYLEQKEDQVTMTQSGIDLLIEILESFVTVAKTAKVDTLRPLATAAVRQSDNREDILKQVKQATGLDVQILSEQEEASYGQYAVLHSIDRPDGITVDIGGGSTEVTLFKDKKMVAYHSFPFGAVSLKNQFFVDKAHNDKDAMKACEAFVSEAFKSLDWLKKAKLPIIAMSGSARNVAHVHQRIIEYPIAGIHGYNMTGDDLEETLKRFKDTKLEDMKDIDGLSSDRQDIIIPATIVFIELYKIAKSDLFIFSNQGLREGLILSHINQTYNSPIDADLIKARSIRQIGEKMDIPPTGSQLRINYTIKLYQELCKVGAFDYHYAIQRELEFASYLYRFGSIISSEADSQHTFYIVSNMDLLGFNHTERLRLALLASYKSRSMFSQYSRDFDKWLKEDTFKDIQKLGGLIKFSDAMNDSQTAPITDLSLNRIDAGHYALTIYHNAPIIAETYRINRHLKHFERALDGNVTLNFISTDSDH